MSVKRHLLACSFLLAIPIIGAGVLAASFDGSPLGSRANAATTTYVPDLDSVLDGRSPGQRRYGWLINTKPEMFSAGDPPIERVLTSVRRRPATIGYPVSPTSAVPLTAFDIVPEQPGESSDLTQAGLPLASSGGGFIGGVPIPGGTGSGGGGGGGSVSPIPDATIPAVPEPASWMMLVLGFAILGKFLRRQRSAAVALHTR